MSVADILKIYNKRLENKINVELVSNGLRNAFIPDRISESDLKYANALGVYYVETNKGGKILTKDLSLGSKINNMQDLGNALGYICANQKSWNDVSKTRISVAIVEENTKTFIFNEMCDAENITVDEINDIYLSKLEIWNNILRQYKFDVIIEYIYSINDILTLTKYDQFDYFRNNIVGYLRKHWLQNSAFIDIIINMNDEEFNNVWNKLRGCLQAINSLASSKNKILCNNFNEIIRKLDEDMSSLFYSSIGC